MDISEFLHSYRNAVTPCALMFFRTWLKEAETAGLLPYQMTEKFAKLYPKGKQIRGALMVLGYELAGGKDIKSIVKASLMVEVLQTALLIADDVFDDDNLRRGELTIHKQWETELPTGQGNGADRVMYGKNMAFDTSIIGLYLAPLVLTGTQFSSQTQLKALDYYFKTVIQVGWGEALDITTPWQTLSEKSQSATTIHDYKTAGYSGVMPLKLGAILAENNNPYWLEPLESYGAYLGKILQIQDDIIGTFGNKSETGKATDSDLKQARWTILIELLFQKLPATESEEVRIILGKQKRSNADIKRIKSLMERYNVVEAAKQKANEYIQKASALIPAITQNKDHQDTLENLVTYMIARNS